MRKVKNGKVLSKTLSRKIVETIMFIILFVFCASYVYILLWGFVIGGMEHEQVIRDPFLFPRSWNLYHYVEAFLILNVNETNMIQMIGNSLWFTLGGASLDVFCSLMLAYACAKFRFFGRNILHGTSLVIMTLPIVGAGSAMYRLIYSLHLNDTVFYLVTFCSGFGSQYIILYGFMQNLSWTYAEAAYIDGASEAQVFFKVMIPMCISPICALAVLRAIAIWNDYQTPMLYFKNLPTIALGIYSFKSQMDYAVRADLLVAASITSIVPILILFMVFNKTLLDLDLGGGLKG